MSTDAGAYPEEYATDIALRDGSTVHVRPVRPDDRDAIRRFLDRVSPESIAFRFFGMADLDGAARWAVDVDYVDRFALVAQSGSPLEIIAHAAYVRENEERAEVAFLVADEWQGRGISTILLAQLAMVAEQHAVATFTAEVLPVNHRMIEVFRESGFPVAMRSTPDAIEIEFPTSLSAEALARFEDRERTAAVAALRSVLEPRSVAVIGASQRPDAVGAQLLRNLLRLEFRGAVYAVNERADVVQSLRAYRSVAEIPGSVDLAVVAVPADAVIDVARECGAAGVRALVVVSAGFAETGEQGVQRQRELLAVCRDAGIRIVGPNSLGVLNTAPEVQLNATFAPHAPVPGRVAFMSQSGGLGIVMIEVAGRLGVGLSSCVSVGNKIDLSGNDLLRYWEQDPGTDLAMLYLESFGNPRKFARIAPRFARRKPLLAVKSGRSAAGARASASPSARLPTADATIDALFEQAGVIRADTTRELFAIAALLSAQPVPRGARVGIVTNATGPGIMCADACSAAGVDVPELGSSVRTRLSDALPGGASVSNPVDMVATASADDYRRTLQTLLDAGACDAILVLFAPTGITAAADVARAVREVAESQAEVAVAAVFMTRERPPAELRSEQGWVPGYELPEDAARAVALAARYGRWRARPPRSQVELADAKPERAAAAISERLADGPGWLNAPEMAALLGSYGLPAGANRAGAASADLDVASMLSLSVVNDHRFGPVIAAGAPGTTGGKISGGACVRITPLSPEDAAEMTASPAVGAALRETTGGAASRAREAIEDVLLRVGAMVENHPEIVEFDGEVAIDPAGQAQVQEARGRVKTAPMPAPISSLRT
jgi:acetyl coenzyme A synthetase (ADP forming)-like protein